MIAAVSSSAAVLTGLAIVGGGFVVLSLAALTIELRHKRELRRAAQTTHKRIRNSIGGAFEDLSRTVFDSESGQYRERGDGRAELERHTVAAERIAVSFAGKDYPHAYEAALGWLGEMRAPAQTLESARNEALDLPVDALAFLAPREEGDIAAVIAFFEAYERLEGVAGQLSS